MNALELTKELVSIPSYVDKTNNEKLVADFIWNYISVNLPWLKLEKQIVEGERYNIIATSSDDPKLIFISHMDTVLPSRETKKMLNPIQKGEKLSGLGASDMKSGLAASIIAAQEMEKREGIALIFDCDEEYYFKGIRKLIEEYSFEPELAIFPEPSSLRIVNGCRGIVELKFNVIGKTAHAGTPYKGINAIESAVKLIEILKDDYSRINNEELGKTTVNLSSLNGGRIKDQEIIVQANAVPDIAEVLIDIRTSDSEIDAKKVISKLKEISQILDVEINDININLDYQSYLTNRKDLSRLEKLIERSDTKLAYKEDLSNGGFFEAAFVSKAWNCPAVSFGPNGEGTSHKPNEFVNIPSIEQTVEIYKSIIEDYL